MCTFLANLCKNLGQKHLEAALRIVNYIKGSLGMISETNLDLNLVAYCDSDWGSRPRTRRSITRYFSKLGMTPISWKSKKQQVEAKV